MKMLRNFLMAAVIIAAVGLGINHVSSQKPADAGAGGDHGASAAHANSGASSSSGSASAQSKQSNSSDVSLPSAASPVAQNHIPVCPGAAADGFARCHAQVIADQNGVAKAVSTPISGYTPAQFRAAYGLGTGVSTAVKTIAIVDAYDDPNIANDLATYSNTLSLPRLNNCAVSTGTLSTPCFQKVDQNGGIKYPRANNNWALETSLDVETAHGICVNCNILLVEANSSSYTDLMAAVNRARLMGAKVISNSYGSSEFSGETAFDSNFNYPGIAFTFSSGDSGFGPTYPAASRFVTSVGGTSLTMTSSNTVYGGETVWSGAGSGCSAYELKPSFQTDSGCARRTIADVSADANPNTGAAIYDSLGVSGQTGWFKVGGTSLASPLVAAVYALGVVSPSVFANSLPYANTSSLHDVTSGSNGSCGGTYLCTGKIGYDGPTGLGTPNGANAF